jgi:hypothetical protein
MTDNNTQFDVPLEQLNAQLAKSGLNLELLVIGAFALRLHKISGQFTANVDSVRLIKNPSVRDLIADIGRVNGLNDERISDSAATLDLPEGMEQRATLIRKYSNIDLFVASRVDLIKLKARAFLHRGEYDSKDLEDLRRMKPSKQEIDEAISFIRLTSTPPEPDLFPDFEDVIAEIKNVAT